MNVIEEGDKIAQKVSYTNYCRLLERLSTADNTASSRRDILSRFVGFWAQQYAILPSSSTEASAGRASFYPVLRLLLPQHDHCRPAYGLRAHSLARLYIKLWGMAPNGPAAKRLMLITDEADSVKSSGGGAKRGDFADLIYAVIGERCPERNTLTLKQINDLLDQLAWATSNEGRLTAFTSLIQSATAIEHKWIARLVVRRDSGCGMSVNSVLQCLHPSASSLWDVTQDLQVLCQRLAGLPLPAAMPVDMGPWKNSPAVPEGSVSLCVPFKPMLCERANSPKELCAALSRLASSSDDRLLLLLETKYDGERIQVHKKGSDYRYWSRNCLEWTASYGANAGNSAGTPNLTGHLHSAFASHVRECIIDGEMMVYNTWTECILHKTSGLDVKRLGSSEQWKKRNCLGPDADPADTSCYQPCLLAFDLLYLNGEVLTHYPLVKRKHLLAEAFCRPASANSATIASPSGAAPDEADPVPHFVPLPVLPGRVYLSGWCQVAPDEAVVSTVFNQLIDSRQEGLVAKVIARYHRSSTYQPGRRNGGGWWKLKPDYVSGLLEDLDCLIVGGYSAGGGDGRQLPGQCPRIRQFMCAVRGPDLVTSRAGGSTPGLPCFLSFCRVSSGLTMTELKDLNRRLRPHWLPYDRKKPNSGLSEWLQVKTERPDFWIYPWKSVILQLHAAELVPTTSYAAGLTCRFPRVLAIRDDKSWTDCLTFQELQRLNTSTFGKLALRRIEPTGGNRPEEEQSGDSGLSDSPAEPDPTARHTIGTATSTSHSDQAGPPSWPPAFKRPVYFAPAMTSTPRKQVRSVVAEVTGGTASTSGLASLSSQSSVVSTLEPFLIGREFCVLFSADRMSGEKSSLESQIVRAGGTVVQNPTANTFCLVVDKLTVKTKNLVNFSSGRRQLRSSAPDTGHDIIRVDWVHECLAAERLLPWRPTDLLATTRASTKIQLASRFDRFGDSYTEEVEPSYLMKLFDVMAGNSEGPKQPYTELASTAIDKLIAAEFSDGQLLSVWKPLRSCSVLLLHLKTAESRGGIADHLRFRLLAIELRRLGASVHLELVGEEQTCSSSSSSLVAHLSSPEFRNLSHVVLVGKPNLFGPTCQLLSTYSSDRAPLHVVTETWASDCIAARCHCEEARYCHSSS